MNGACVVPWVVAPPTLRLPVGTSAPVHEKVERVDNWKYRWYISNIDLSVSVLHRHFIYRFSIYQYCMGDKWSIG